MEESILQFVGTRVRLARAEADLSQEDVAQKAGLKQQKVISQIESARRKLSVAELAAIAQALNKPLIWFLTDMEIATVRESADAAQGRDGVLPSEALDELLLFILELKRKYGRK